MSAWGLKPSQQMSRLSLAFGCSVRQTHVLRIPGQDKIEASTADANVLAELCWQCARGWAWSGFTNVEFIQELPASHTRSPVFVVATGLIVHGHATRQVAW